MTPNARAPWTSRVHVAAGAVACALLAAACQGRGVSPEPIGPSSASAGAEEAAVADELTPSGSPTGVAPEETPTPGETPTAEGHVEISVDVIASNLEVPWAVAFLPDGDALVTERNSGRILRIGEDGEVTEAQQLTVASPPREAGLLGIAVSPTYAQDELVYVYLSNDEDNRVVRFRLGESPEPVLTGIPGPTHHNGGRIAFGPDEMLYVTTGDAGQPRRTSQDPESLGGKILRITPEGEPAPGNPFDSPVYSLGHRNVQGLAWTADGTLLATEFGADDWDEINVIIPGGNYGWPQVEGMGGEPEFIDPVHVWKPAEASPSGATVLIDGAIPQWEGNLLVSSLRGQRLWRLEFDGDAVVDQESLLDGEFGRLRHVAQAPDGSLWILVSNHDGWIDPGPEDDRILRLGP